jgi:parvulin-like peptidyl-prolyl isomerase
MSLKGSNFGSLGSEKKGSLGSLMKPFSVKNAKESLNVGGLKPLGGMGGQMNLNKPLFGRSGGLKLKDSFGTIPPGERDLGSLGKMPTSRPTKPTSRPVARVSPRRVAPPVRVKPKPRVKPTLGSILSMAKKTSSVLANVNNEPVEKSDFLWAMALYRRVWEGQNGPLLREHLPLFRKKVLEHVINEKLIYQSAIQKGTKLTQKDRQRGMHMFRSRLRGMNMADVIRRVGLTHQQFQKIMERQLYLEKYKVNLAKNIKITKQMLLAHYKKTTGAASVRVEQIVVELPEQPSEAVRSQAQTRAKAILKQAQSDPSTFSTLQASTNAQAGVSSSSLGVLKAGDTIKAIEDVVFSLQKGQVGGLVETSMGFHILKVVDKKEPRPFAQVQGKIMEQIYQVRLLKLLQSEADDLRKEAEIEILVPWGKD